jgi:flagellar protein FliO/FliZ
LTIHLLALVSCLAQAAAEPVAEAIDSGVDDGMPVASLVVDPTAPVVASTSTSGIDSDGAALTTMKEPEASVVIEKIEPKNDPEVGAGTSETNKISEAEIPVLASKSGEKKAEGSAFTRMMMTLGVFAVVLAGMLVGLKRWSRRRGATGPNPTIKVLTQHVLGPKKSLAIIQVAGESILIGVTDQNINMIKSLALIDDEVPESVPNNFNHALTEFEEPERLGPAPRKLLPSVEREDFAMHGLGEIRDKVSTRLRNMKDL